MLECFAFVRSVSDRTRNDMMIRDSVFYMDMQLDCVSLECHELAYAAELWATKRFCLFDHLLGQAVSRFLYS